MVQKILAQLENLAFRLQLWYMKPKMTAEKVGRHFAFFHPRPTGKIVLEEYRKRLQTLQGRTLKAQSTKGSNPMGKVVLVTGCFDVLHIEHEKLLRAAKNLGGRLLVGVETDGRVRKLKGPGRPVNQLAVRINNLQKLGIADEVFALPEKFFLRHHFEKLVEGLRPGILAVSSSTPNLESKQKIMQKFGGKVELVLEYNPKISTTKLLTKRRKNSKIQKNRNS